MFSTPKRPDRPENYDNYTTGGQPTAAGATVIARGVKVEGEFVSQGDVVIEGEVNGRVSTSGLLTIGSEARLKAEVSADDAIVSGSIEGTVTVKKRLELRSTARIHGDVECETAVIEAGAVLNGKCAIGSAKQSGSKERAPAKVEPTSAA